MRSSPRPEELWRQARRAAGIVTIASVGLVAIPAWAGLQRPGRRAAVRARGRRLQVELVLRLLGVHVRVEPAAPPPAAGGRLVVANHRSALDILVLLWLFDGWFVSRGDVAAWPLLGPAAARARVLFVDREHAGSRAAALGAVRRQLDRGDTVIVFPEGTTFPGDLVHPFSSGCFAAATASGAEIVPVGLACEAAAEYLDESFARHFARVAARPRTHVVARLGAPRRVARGSSPVALAAEVRTEVQALVNAARADSGAILAS